jgi:hypothetical protein
MKQDHYWKNLSRDRHKISQFCGAPKFEAL